MPGTCCGRGVTQSTGRTMRSGESWDSCPCHQEGSSWKVCWVLTPGRRLEDGSPQEGQSVSFPLLPGTVASHDILITMRQERALDSRIQPDVRGLNGEAGWSPRDTQAGAPKAFSSPTSFKKPHLTRLLPPLHPCKYLFWAYFSPKLVSSTKAGMLSIILHLSLVPKVRGDCVCICV